MESPLAGKLKDRFHCTHCHNYFQTIWPYLGPSTVVDQSARCGDLYTETVGGRGTAGKDMGRKKVWVGIQL